MSEQANSTQPESSLDGRRQFAVGAANLPLTGKVAVITGAARGIGRRIAAMVTGACYDVTTGDSAHGMD